MPIHPTAIVDPKARVAETAEIGPYCILGPEVEIGARTAQMFMHLARNAILANPNHWFAFPPSWRTLYELSKIRPKTRLQQLIGSGKIYPGMTREEAIELRTGRQQQPGKLIVSTIIAQLLRQSEALSDAALLRDLRSHHSITPAKLAQLGQRLTQVAKRWRGKAK